MKCTKCNNEVSENSKFCNICGALVEEQSDLNNAYANMQGYQNYNQPNNHQFNGQPNAPQYNQGYNQQYNQGYNQQPYGQPGYQPPYGYNNPMPNPGDVPSAGLNILAFFFPMVGLILYLIWKDQYPTKAKSIGKWALISFVINFVLGIVIGVFTSMMTVFSYM